jgi:HK97 family phage major capsid protein
MNKTETLAAAVRQAELAVDAVDERIRSIETEARTLRGTIERDGSTAGRETALERYRVGTEAAMTERDALRGALEEAREAHLVARRADIGEMVKNGRAVAVGPFQPIVRSSPVINFAAAGPDQLRAAAFSAIEHGGLLPAAQDRLDRVIRSEPTPAHARYIAAVGSGTYLAAFGALMRDKDRAAIELTSEERTAVREARDAQSLLMFALGSDPGGLSTGWPLPMQIDPTITVTGDGAANPLRRLATVRTIAGKTLTVASAAQVAAGYGAEGSDVAEVTPSPTPTKLTAERGAAFVRLTYELLSDFQGATGEIGKLFSDARDNLEAQKFCVGTGSDEPFGIIAGLTPFDGAVAAVADLLAVQADLGARYQAGASWLAPLAVLNAIGQYVAAADTSNAPIIDAAGNLLRKPMNEASFMTAGDLIYGNLKAGFTIVDRLGMAVESTGATFNPSTGVPDGSRGFLALWRSGSGVTDADALRLLAGA